MVGFNFQMEGLDAIAARIDGMVHKLAHAKAVDVGQVLSEWQTKDMHRRRPFTMRSRRKGRAVTVVRPHSRYEMQHSHRFQMKVRRRLKRKPDAAIPLVRRRWSTRPILRAELEEQLSQRVHELRERLKW
jgi:hypothetical protein